MQIHLLVGTLLIMVVNTQETLGSASNQEISGDYSDTSTVPILNSTTVTNVITANETSTIMNATQPCLNIWQKIQILLNFATFDVNQYLNCLANNGRNTHQNSLIIMGFFIIAILMNN